MKLKLFIIFFILLASILYFDFRVYKNFVLNIESRANDGRVEKLFLLKTPLLEKAAEEIRKKDAFLQNPKYPLLKDPF
jgi:hypothetical protein